MNNHNKKRYGIRVESLGYQIFSWKFLIISVVEEREGWQCVLYSPFILILKLFVG